MPICISIVLKLLNSLHDINTNAMHTGRSIVTTGIVAFLLAPQMRWRQTSGLLLIWIASLPRTSSKIVKQPSPRPFAFYAVRFASVASCGAMQPHQAGFRNPQGYGGRRAGEAG